MRKVTGKLVTRIFTKTIVVLVSILSLVLAGGANQAWL